MIVLCQPYGLFHLKILEFLLSIKQIICHITSVISWRKYLRRFTVAQGLFLARAGRSPDSRFWSQEQFNVWTSQLRFGSMQQTQICVSHPFLTLCKLSKWWAKASNQEELWSDCRKKYCSLVLPYLCSILDVDFRKIDWEKNPARALSFCHIIVTFMLKSDWENTENN